MAPFRFVWLDMEMTGLDPEHCSIIEVALIITDEHLSVLAELERVIWQPDSVLSSIEPFVREMHTKNGLLNKVKSSQHSTKDVEGEMLALVAEHCGYREGVLAGNSIHQDRRFLYRYMPLFERYLHYRQLDVSSLKILANIWFDPPIGFAKANQNHTALGDIRQSIEELKCYKRNMLKVMSQ